MISCPYKNSKSWKNLVAARGETVAHNLWFLYDGDVPQEEYDYNKSLASIESKEDAKQVLKRGQQDPNIREKYFFDEPSDGFLKSSIVLERIAASNHPLNKLAKYLLPLVTEINDSNIQLVQEGDFAGIYMGSHININENAYFKGKGVEPTIIHEVMHALTHDILRTDSTALNEFKKLYDYLKPMFPAYNEETNEGTYALYNLDEFVVALFSDAEFINQLLKIPAIDTSKSSVFKEIFDFIVGLFNISEEDSIYRQAFNVASNLLEDAKNYSDFERSNYEVDSMNDPQATNLLLEQFNEREVGKSYSLMGNVWKKELARIRNTYNIEPNVIKDNYSAKVIGAKGFINTPQALPKFKAKEELANLTEDNILISFLRGFDFDVQGFSNEYGYTNTETLDLLNRVLFVDVNNIEDSFKNQFADFLQFFLKYNPEYIELTKTYSKEQIKQSFIDNLKVTNEEINIFKQLIDYVLSILRNKRDDLNYYTNDIINRIYNNDTTVLNYYQEVRPGSSSKSALSSFAKNILKDSQAAEIINGFADDFSLTGSIVLGEQGDVFTSDTNPFHDIDYAAPGKSLEEIEEIVYRKFPNTKFFRTIPNEDYTTYSYIIPTGNYRIENLDIIEKEKNGKIYKDIKSYDIVDEENNIVGTYKMEKVPTGKLTAFGNQEKKKIETETGIKAKIVDFFQKDVDDVYFVKNINGVDVKMATWQEIMKAKLDYVRPKDVHDILLFNRQRLVEKEQKQLPLFKARPKNTLNFIEQQAFKDGIAEGDVVGFTYWSESTSQLETNKKVYIQSILQDRFQGIYEDGEEKTFKFINIISNAVPEKYSIEDQLAFKNKLQIGKTVKVVIDSVPVTGIIEEVKPESVILTTNQGPIEVEYNSIDKENHEKNIIDIVTNLRAKLEEQLVVFGRRTATEEQIQRVASIQLALSQLDNYKQLTDLVGFLKTLQTSITSAKALFNKVSDSNESVTKKLALISFLKEYITSFGLIKTLASEINKLESSEELKDISIKILGDLSLTEDNYYDIAIPQLAEWLWSVFPEKLNKDLAATNQKLWTKERLIEELRSPSGDLDFFNTYLVPITNSNDVISGLFGKILKKSLDAARYLTFKLEQSLLPLFEKVKSQGVEMNEVYKKFYTTKLMEVTEDGKKVQKEVRVIVEQYDIQQYFDTTNKFGKELADMQLRIDEATGQEKKDLIDAKKAIAAQLNLYKQTNGTLKTNVELYNYMMELRNPAYSKYNIERFDDYLKKYYKINNQAEDNAVRVIDEESGNVFYYEYRQNKWDPNPKAFETKEYEALLNGDPDVLALYTEIKKIYDDTQKMLPDNRKMKGVLPVNYEDSFLNSTKKWWKNLGKDTDKQYLSTINGEPYRQIPIGYSRPLDINESSNDILTSLLRYASEVNTFKAKNEILGGIDNISAVLNKTNPFDATQINKTKSDINNRKDAINKFIKQVFYGENRASNTIYDKAIDYLGRATSIARMTLKPSTAFANIIIGNYGNIAEAFGGRNFNFNDLKSAQAQYYELLFTDRTKLNNMINSLDAIQGRFNKELGDAFKSMTDKIGLDNAFMFQDFGEHEIQGVAMLALLKSWNIDIPQDGIFDTATLPENFIDTLHELNKANNGVYSDFDKLYMQDNAIFRLMLQFRKYVVPTFRSRFSGLTGRGSNKYRIDLESGTVESGYYRSFAGFVYNNIILVKNLPNILSNYDALTDIEKEGIWRTLLDVTAFLSITFLFLPLAGADDDDWEEADHTAVSNFIHWELIYQLGRLRSDIAAYLPFVGFKDQMRMVNQPFAAASTMKQMYKIVSMVFDFEEDKDGNISIWKQYQRDYGRYEKGDLKIWQPISKINPLDNFIEDFSPDVQYNDFKAASQ